MVPENDMFEYYLTSYLDTVYTYYIYILYEHAVMNRVGIV